MPTTPLPIPHVQPEGEIDAAPDARGVAVRMAVLGAWIVLGLVETLKVVVARDLAGIPPLPAGQALINNLPWWLAWAALTPAVVWLARRLALDRRPYVLAGAGHLLGAMVASLVHLLCVGTLFFYTTSRGLGPFRDAMAQVRYFINGFLLMDVLTYGVIVGVWYALEFRRRARSRELEAARLRELAVQARLDALRRELDPHFLYNVLNSVAGLVREGDRRGAVRMLARLGDLLRFTLERHDDGEVPLERELDILRRYLAIEQVRFRDRLRVRVRVEPEARSAAVPPLLLQPLVENAVRHGIGDRPGPGTIELAAKVEGGRLVLAVRDDGAGLGAAAGRPNGTGTGLSNVRERLATRYGDGAGLRLEDADPGTRVVIELPHVALDADPAGDRSVDGPIGADASALSGGPAWRPA